MKKALLSLAVAAALFAPASFAFATATSWDYTSGILQPLVSQKTAQVNVPNIYATSTTATSTLKNTNLSGPTVEILGQYITNLVNYIRGQFSQGTGIGISSGVISNTGVTSLTAGTGISLSGSTGGVTITATGGAGSTGLATTSPVASSNLLEYSAAGAGSAFGVATSSIGAGTGLTFSGTAGAQVGGSNGTYSVNTTQNITTLSNLSNGTINSASGVLYNTATSTPTLTAPITYSGTLGQFIGGTSGAFGCTTATGSVNGCLSSTDWTTFNGKQSALTFSTGLTNTAGTVTVNASQNISTLSNLTVAGLVQTTAGGALSSALLTSSQVTTALGFTPISTNQTITLSGAVTGSGTTAITTAFGTLGQGILGNPASAATIPTAQATSTLYGPVQGGKVLGGINGVLGYIATTTMSCSTGVTCTFSGGNEAFSIANSAITDVMLSSTFVKTLTVTTAQGVSGSFTAGATPVLSLTLGALTGATSYNGLVVTANTGVITTGTWNGTTIAIANGGTNATSFGTTGGITAYDGTRLTNFSGYTLNSGLLTATNASTTNITASNELVIPNGATKGSTVAGQIELDTTNDQLKVGDGSATAIFDPRVSFTFGIATTTAWTGPVTAPVVTIPMNLTWTQISCTVQPAGATLTAQYQYANPSAYTTVNITSIAASTTPGVTALTSSNTPTANATSTITFSSPSGSPTSAACTLTGTVSGT